MAALKGRRGFTLVELMVVISIIAILASFLLPVVGRIRIAANRTHTLSLLASLQTAIDEYFNDFGTYPPDATSTSQNDYDKPSETLYFYLSGENVSSPNASLRTTLQNQRRGIKVYMDFRHGDLADHDKDGRYELVDSFGYPWLYVRPPFPGTMKIGRLGTSDRFPWHNKSKYDLYSVGPDGKTGPTWTDHPLMFELGPNNDNSFYFKATSRWECGAPHSGAKFSLDDIGNM